MEVELKEMKNVTIFENNNDEPNKSEKLKESHKNMSQNKENQKTFAVKEANSGSDNTVILEKEKNSKKPRNGVFSCESCEYTCKNQKT